MKEITIPAYTPFPKVETAPEEETDIEETDIEKPDPVTVLVPEYITGRRALDEETTINVIPVSSMRKLLALTADNPAAILAIHHHKEITREYKQFIQYADGSLKHIMAVIGNIADCIVEPADKPPFLPNTEYEHIDACAIACQRLFADLLGIKTATSVDYEPALYQTGDTIRQIRHDAAADVIDDWIVNLPSSTHQKPFTAHTYQSRRTASEEYTATARVSSGYASQGEFDIRVHTPRRTFGARAAGASIAAPGSIITITGEERIPTGSIITREEQPRPESVKGIIRLSAYDFGGPRKPLFSGASFNAFIGALSSHAILKTPTGIGMLMPGDQQHGVRLTFVKPLPVSTGDTLTLTISTRTGARFCGEFEVTSI